MKSPRNSRDETKVQRRATTARALVLAYAPSDPEALSVKRIAPEHLLAASGRENHSEVQWLEQEINSVTPEENQ